MEEKVGKGEKLTNARRGGLTPPSTGKTHRRRAARKSITLIAAVNGHAEGGAVGGRDGAKRGRCQDGRGCAGIG